MNEQSPLLLLIDGLNIVRRCYGATDAPDSPDKAQRACRASIGTFRRLFDTHQPTHGLAVFDHGGLTWRHELYAEYKQSRKPMPEVLRNELPSFYGELDRQFGLKSVAVPAVEADDVIALVHDRWASTSGGQCIVASMDSDLCVLIAKGASIWDPFENNWRTAEWVTQKFGVPPAQLVDLKALEGDSTDDIPGVAGVGRKTALELLHEYGSLDGVLEAAASIKGKRGESVRKDRERALLSRRLVQFNTSFSVGMKLSALRIGHH